MVLLLFPLKEYLATTLSLPPLKNKMFLSFFRSPTIPALIQIECSPITLKEVIFLLSICWNLGIGTLFISSEQMNKLLLTKSDWQAIFKLLTRLISILADIISLNVLSQSS